MTYTIPDYLKEQAATEIDENGEVSDATKETIANLVDEQSLDDIYAEFDSFVADREYLSL